MAKFPKELYKYVMDRFDDPALKKKWPLSRFKPGVEILGVSVSEKPGNYIFYLYCDLVANQAWFAFLVKNYKLIFMEDTPFGQVFPAELVETIDLGKPKSIAKKSSPKMSSSLANAAFKGIKKSAIKKWS